MGLTNEFRSGHSNPRTQDSGEDGVSTDHHMNIIVKRDVVLTESAAL